MADVFAADRIIWVEGETEELCFPAIMRHRGIAEKPGTVITSVIGTGSLSYGARGVKLAYKLYLKISKLAAPLVSEAVFSFDREGLKPEQIVELKNMAEGNLYILPRRMIENYLIHPVAIATLFDRVGITATEAEISEWLIAKGGDNEFSAPHVWKGDIAATDWLTEVHGASLLEEMALALSGKTTEYNKTSHTPMLVDWLLENDPAFIEELCQHVEAVVSHGK
jgi:hypothetical protein